MSWVSVERQARNILAGWIGRVFPIEKHSVETLKTEWAEGRIRKVLLVRINQGLGDLLLATPMFRALKASRPDIQVHMAAASYNAVAVRGNPRLDKLWVWDKKKTYWPVYALNFFRALRAERYDLAILISSHTPSFTSFLLARVAGAQRILSFETPAHYGGANWSRWLAHTELPNPPAPSPEWVKFMDLARPLGVGGSYEPEFALSDADRANASAEWFAYAFPSGRPVVGLYLGGNPDRPERLWPAASWAELARLLSRDYSVLAILPPAGMLSGSARPEPGVYDEFSRLLGRTLPVFRDSQLSKVAAFLSHLDLFVCPDGGLMHIAIASRVRTLGLCFETDPDRWVPPVPWAVGLRAADARSSGLSPQTVFETIQRLLVPMKEAVQ